MSERFVNGLTLLAVFLMTFLTIRCSPVPVDRHYLSVHVVYLLDGTSVTGATVEIVSLNGSDSSDSDGHVVAHKSLNKEGWVFFHLPTGRYLLRMKSGYTGQVEMNLEEDKEVVLKVIRVLR